MGSVQSYLNQIDKLYKEGDITEEEYILQKNSPEARAALMEITLGNEQTLFTEGSVEDIYNRTRWLIDYENTVIIDKQSNRLRKAEVRHQNTAKSIAHFVATIVKVLFGLLFIVAAIAGLPFGLIGIQPFIPNIALGMAIFIVAVIMIYLSWKGINGQNLSSVMRRFESGLTDQLFKVFMRLAGLQTDG